MLIGPVSLRSVIASASRPTLDVELIEHSERIVAHDAADTPRGDAPRRRDVVDHPHDPPARVSPPMASASPGHGKPLQVSVRAHCGRADPVIRAVRILRRDEPAGGGPRREGDLGDLVAELRRAARSAEPVARRTWRARWRR